MSDETTNREETLADIVAEMYGFRNHPNSKKRVSGQFLAGVLFSLAYRIEAAVKREAVAGNAAALREALAALLAWCEAHAGACAIRVAPVPDDEAAVWDERDRAMERARTALAAPPRNCDRFATEEDANAAFDKMCDLRGAGLRSCIGCKYNGGERGGLPSISRCRVAWLFDTATPEEGGEP